MRYIILFLLSFPVYADWDVADRWLGAAAVTSLAVDWGQTRTIAKNPALYYEQNRILGSHPSTGKVDAYFATCIVGTLLIADWLTPTNRKVFLGTIIAVELVVTTRNQQLGVKVAF